MCEKVIKRISFGITWKIQPVKKLHLSNQKYWKVEMLNNKTVTLNYNLKTAQKSMNFNYECKKLFKTIFSNIVVHIPWQANWHVAKIIKRRYIYYYLQSCLIQKNA